jgi:hypothetical protein
MAAVSHAGHVHCGASTGARIIARVADGGALRTISSLTRVLACVALSSAAVANPWLPPGDLSLRHDIQLLADAGIIKGPVTTWPMSWPDLARDVLAAPSAPERSPAFEHALARVQAAARRASVPGFSGLRVGLSAAERPIQLRDFSDSPREEGSAQAGARWMADRWVAHVEATVVADPDDGKKFRYDGSYVGVVLSNVMLSAGAMDRWWGPGWEGSLILSSNARPVPAVALERNYSDAPRWRLLRWIGPWRAIVAMGQMEGSDVAVPDVRLFAARVNFRPLPWLELGLSRTAQWCGEGRPCDLETFGNLLIGRDNRDAALPEDREPGNQMAGYDLRMRSPWPRMPAAVYLQLIGEDEAGGLPSKLLGLTGLEMWGDSAAGSWRAHVEYSDTSCNFTRSQPLFDCAYRHSLYPQGYVFRGRPLGHAMGGDGRMYSIGVLLSRPAGDTWSMRLSRAETDRGGLTERPRNQLRNLDLQYNRAFVWGALGVGVGFEEADHPLERSSDVRGYVQWRQRF